MILKLEERRKCPEVLETKEEEGLVKKRARIWEEKIQDEEGKKNGTDNERRRKRFHSETNQLADPSRLEMKNDEKSIGKNPKLFKNYLEGIPDDAKKGIKTRKLGGLRISGQSRSFMDGLRKNQSEER